jgi:hypothetical protein
VLGYLQTKQRVYHQRAPGFQFRGIIALII